MALTCIKTMAAVLLAAALAQAPAHAQTGSDADVLAARDAAQRGQWKALEALRLRLAGHPLEAYPAYWQLAGTLDRADPAEIAAFLARYADSPLAESLRREWLRSLGSAASWDLFRAEYPKLLGEEVEITCYSFQERLARADPEVMAEARALFVSAREGAATCDPVFAALMAAKAVSETDVWDRLRRLLAAGAVRDAKRANALLGARVALAEKAIDRANADPARFLANDKATRPSRAEQELAIFAVERLARSKPEEAAERLAALSARLGPEASRQTWGQVAWQGAMAHHPKALEWYALAGATPLTDSQIAWKARAALRAADWKAVLAAIDALSIAEAREPAWRYWKARALHQLGPSEAADNLLRSLTSHPGFYGLLAAEEVGVPIAPEWNGWKPAQADLDRVAAHAGIQRALALYRLGLAPEALREWLWAIRGYGDRDLLAAAEIARLANVPDRAINTADRTLQLHDLSQRFPTPHREALEAAAKQWDLDEAMLYAIIRQESRFSPEARSPMGAMGLMQVMPATGRWIARQIQVQPFRPQMLASPDLNVRMGTYYYRRVLTALGEPLLATAAYNAGPGRASRWRDERALEGAIYAETIPFGETRDYVKKVFTNAWFYRHRLTGKSISLHDMLGTVRGRAESLATPIASYIP
jgi:soluble lytic murein transglycosylase